MNLPKELVLDYKIWRSGGPFHYHGEVVGEGDTQLLNNEGYMCCLGQFCEQAGVDRYFLRDKEYPDALGSAPKLLVKNGYTTDLASEASEINDNHQLPTAERVVKLQKLFRKHKKTIVLKNFPEKILKQIEDLGDKE
jgi:hemin uptake protein HemP